MQAWNKFSTQQQSATKTSLAGAHNKRSDQGARRSSKSFDSKKGGREEEEEVCGVYHAFIVHEI